MPVLYGSANPDKEDIIEAIFKQVPLGLDVVYECAGEQETLDEADVDFMITHRFKVDQAQQAFDMVADYRDDVVKALIEF